MEPRRAWGVFSGVVIGCDAVVGAILLLGGSPVLPTLLVILGVPLVYGYVLYKRYLVEVVPASDLKLFDDADDLRILCGIYALETSGSGSQLRKRLEVFAEANSNNAFVWVTPKAVSWLGSAVSRSPKTAPKSARELARGLLSDAPRGPKKQARPLLKRDGRPIHASLPRCPVCDARSPLLGTICKNCGADLEFYAILSGSKVGRRLVSAKASSVRRKLRYDVPSLGGKR